MIERDDMTFPMEEHKRRLSELRKRMADRLLDVVVINDPENIYYLTEYKTTGYSFFQALVVPLEDEPYMVTRQLEASNIVARTWVEKMRPYSDFEDAVQMLVSSLREMGLLKKRIGFERNSYFLPAYQQDTLINGLLGERIQDCFGIVEEGRICKSQYEIDIMKKSAKATEAGMKAGIEAVKAGVSENEIGAAISSAMFTNGGEIPSVMPYVTTGPRTMIGHASFEGRIIQPGEHAFLEVGGCYRQYHTAMMRTVILGELDDEMAYAQERMKNALATLHDIARPGLVVSDLDQALRKIISVDETSGTLITRAGYSIGIAFPPSWDEGYILSIGHGNPTALREGMTFHIIPWVWGIGGKRTCGISDTIYITKDGCKSFFNMDQDFTIKPEFGKKSEGKIEIQTSSKNSEDKKNSKEKKNGSK